jgi:outer membrane lipoprotein-sorting protein
MKDAGIFMQNSKWIGLLVGIALSGVAIARGAAPPMVNPTGAGAPGQPAAADMTVDQVLDALDKRGQDLKSFDAKVELTEEDVVAQLKSTRTGIVRFQRKSADDARLRVVFDKNISGKTIGSEKIEYLLDNGWLTDRDYKKRIEVRRQVLRPGEKVNLLKLGEGPFPLPIGQKKEDVKKLFTVTKEKPAKDDPPGTVHIVLQPLKGTQFAKKFSSIDVWMDTKTQFPVRIDTSDAKGQMTKTTELREVRINPNLGDADFVPEKISPEQWNIHEEPFRD